MLKSNYTKDLIECGTDEAGRGCLAGPVVAAAVIFPKDYKNTFLDDSKKLTDKKRFALREIIEKEALAYAVHFIDASVIDSINILNASFLAMSKSIQKLDLKPELILVDGNRFKSDLKIPHQCIIKGDSKFLSIAAASILAKTYRDDFMTQAHCDFPNYAWDSNKGYPTKAHREGIRLNGPCKLHRKSFTLLKPVQLKLDL